jgi:hypothetical protein
MEHQIGDSCDCQICGWHVHDIEPLTATDEWVIFDSGCLQSRPRADQHRESPRGRRRSELPVDSRVHARRALDAGRLSAAGESAPNAGWGRREPGSEQRPA